MGFRPSSDALVQDLRGLEEAELLELVRARPLPQHVAIIMDGNGRWAVRRGLPRVAGHREGIKATRAVVRAADNLGIRFLTLYAFSSENWNRPSDEVATLMSLLERAIDQEMGDFMANNVRLKVIGRADGVPARLKRGIDQVVSATAVNTGMTLIMAFNYGGRDELVDACRALAKEVHAGRLRLEEIDEVRVSRALYTEGIPDPDLMIRTSGEMRISNFLLWQIAYTEFWVTDTLWPDFGRKEFYLAVADFQNRERRFGRT